MAQSDSKNEPWREALKAASKRLEEEVAEAIQGIDDPKRSRRIEKKLGAAMDRVERKVQWDIEEGPPEELGVLDFVKDTLGGLIRKGEKLSAQDLKELLFLDEFGGKGTEVDPFGYDEVYWTKVEPLFEYLYETYWRVETSGTDNIPDQGRGLIVSNHSGVLPWDAVMIKVAVAKEHSRHREVRPLVEDFVNTLPYVSALFLRIGCARACRENAERLLADDKLAAVFPEGIKGVAKHYKDRYKIQRFGRGGTVKLAIKTRSPIIPCAVVGGEEIHPVLGRADLVGRLIGLPALPITPTFPFLGPLGFIPLPSKWFITFGRPISYDKYKESDIDNEILVNRLNEQLRGTVQKMIHEVLKSRKSAWFG